MSDASEATLEKAMVWVPVDAAMGWRPIETAPKDGTRVLIVDDEGDMDVAGYVEQWDERIEFVRKTKDGAVYRTVTEDVGYWSADTVRFPTRWMPLPEAPDADNEGSGRNEESVDHQILTATTAEQKARDLLERLGVENAQSYSAGDLVELANLIAERDHLLKVLELIGVPAITKSYNQKL